MMTNNILSHIQNNIIQNSGILKKVEVHHCISSDAMLLTINKKSVNIYTMYL